jgi:hypothetical protein
MMEDVIYNGGIGNCGKLHLATTLQNYSCKMAIKGIKLSAVANNVLIIKKWVDNIDPESFGYSSDNLIGLESTGVPTTRGIGFNLNVKF